MLRFPLKTLAVAIGLTALAGGAEAASVYKTVLSGANENPPNASPGTGEATVVIDGDMLTLSTTFSDLLGPTTIAHIHCCAPATDNAGVATPVPTFPAFPAGVTSGSYSHSFDLTQASSYNPGFITLTGSLDAARAALIAGLTTGQAYLNIHSQQFPGGEIRGNFALVPEPATWAMMIIGFGAAGAMLRRSRQTAHA